MQKKGTNKRQIIFEKFSKNFALVMNNPRLNALDINFYLCPLCLKSFQEFHLDQTIENPLTIEDVPPKALNGKPILLTCKKCNNENGSIYDSELGKWYKAHCALEGKGNLDIKMETKSSRSFKAKFSRDLGNQKVEINSSRKNPYAEENILKFQNKGGGKVNFIFHFGDDKKINVGFVRFAYLYAFYYFGYSYILSPGGKYINDYLSFNKNDEHVPLVVSSGIENLKEGIYKIFEPIDITSFLVVINVGGEVKKTIGIIIPGPKVEHLENFKLLNKEDIGPLKFQRINQLDIIRHPFIPYQVWN